MVSYGRYTWAAEAAPDGSTVTWTLTVTETGSGSPLSNYMEFRIPDEFNPIVSSEITRTISPTGTSSVRTPSNLDDGVGRYWAVFTTGSGSGSDHTLTISFTTTVTNGPNTTIEDFSLPYLPTTQSYVNTRYTTYGPNNTISNSGRDPVAGSVLWLDENTQPTVTNPAFLPPVTTTDVTIKKVDQDDQPLAGAEFTLVPVTGGEGYTPSAGENTGETIFTDVAPGTYTLTETVVPSGYTGVAPQEVDIPAPNNTITVKNQLIPNRIKIEAKDQAGNPIVGAGYIVTNTTTGAQVGAFTTGTDGTVTTSQLVAGNDYSVEQVSLPEGYTAPEDTTQVIASLPTGTTTVTFTNTADTHTHVTVNLKKANTSTNLAGGTFEVWTTGIDGIGAMRIAGPVTTGADGNANFGNIPNGQLYDIRQINAPVGYTAASPQQLDLRNVTANGAQTVQFYNSDVTLTVNLKAQGKDTNLAGAIFVAKQNGLQIGEAVTTDADGNAVFSGLLRGQTYTIEEIAPPVGYFPYAPSPTVTMDADSKFLNLTNVPLTMTITLQTPDGVPVPNTDFDLKDAEDTVVVSGTTNEDGQIIITGPPLTFGASYTIVQTSVETGFTPAEPTVVTLDQQSTMVNIQNGQTATLHLNLYESFTLPLIPLEGAQFIIKNAEGVIVGSGTTDANGELSIIGLTDGATYTIEQVSAPAGYIPIEPKTIVLDGITFTQPLFNTKGTQTTGTIKIVAVDQDDPGITLAGATFVVADASGRQYPVTTNAQGEGILTNLPFATYTIVQTGAPSGYLANGESAEIELTQALPSAELTMQNKYIGVDLLPGVMKTTVRDFSNEAPIPGVRMRATDEDGESYEAITDANGVVYFSGLDVTKRYSVEPVEAPYQYGEGPWPGALLENQHFFKPGYAIPGSYMENVFWLDPVPVETLIITVIEKGDIRIPIPNAEVEVTFPDGTTQVFTTDSEGKIILPNLPRGYFYSARQLTTDDRHLVDPNVLSMYIERYATMDFRNPLIDINSEKRTITATKAWPEGKPSSVASLTFTLYADDVATEHVQTLPDGTGTVTFEGLNKYNADHVMINYSVVESPIDNYYAVYTKNDTDGYQWTVSNYEGNLIGECRAGTFWISNDGTATQYYPDGSRTGKTITLSFNTSGSGSEHDTYGYGIAVTPYALADGNQYMLGVNRYGYVTMHNVSTSSDETLVATSTSVLVSGYGGSSDYANTLAFSQDGKWLYFAGSGDRTLYVFDAQAVVDWVQGASSQLTPHHTINLPERLGTNIFNYIYIRGFAGDVIELPNGDLLMSGVQSWPDAGHGTGLFVAQKTGDGTYTNPVHVGDVAHPISGTDKTIQGLALVYVDGTPKVVVTRYAGSAGWNNYTLNELPAYTHRNKSYGLTIFGIDGGKQGTPADAASGSMEPCSATVNKGGSKTWVNDTPADRPTQIRVELLRNGAPMAPAVYKDVAPDEFGNWNWLFENLPKYDENGNSIQYATAEVGYWIGEAYYDGIPSGYTVSQEGDFNLTNTLGGPTSITLTRVWVGGLPDKPVYLDFYLERRPVGSSDENAWVKVPDSDIAILSNNPNQTHTWENLPGGY